MFFWFLVLLILIILIVIYYLYCIETYRYYQLKSIDYISYYDEKYLNLPRVKSYRNVVISLTTIPCRINKLKPTLASILDSNYRVDKIYLNIPKITLKGEKYQIPNWLKNSTNITINRVEEDLGPATKLLPILKKEKEAIIIVIDDDVIYGSKLIENYIREFYNRKERDALTIFGRNVENGEMVPEYPSFLQYRGPCYIDTLKGHDSFLVTPEMFHSHVFNFKIAPKECFWVDDIWFSSWLKYNGVKIYSLGFQCQNIPITNIENIDTSNSLSTTKNSSKKIGKDNNELAVSYFRKNWGVMF